MRVPLPRRPARAACVLPLVLAVACQRQSAPGYFGTVVPRHGPDEVWTNNSTEPEYIDPGKASDSVSGVVIRNIFAGLTQPHPKTLEPRPDVARAWRVSDAGLTYTFDLRPTRWTDGTPVTAHDFVYAWKRTLDPTTASKYGSFLYPLRHAEAFNRRALWIQGATAARLDDHLRALFGAAGRGAEIRRDESRAWAFVFLKDDALTLEARRALAASAEAAARRAGDGDLTVRITDASVVGVRALDDLTLEARLEGPLPYFLYLTSYYTAFPVPRHVLGRLERDGVNTDLWTRLGTLVSNGAYRLTEWKFRQHMIFERNDDYWDAARTRIRRVKALMVEDYNTALNLFKGGELDYPGEVGRLPSEFEDHLAGFREYHRFPELAVYYYSLNVNRPSLNDRRVRQALGMTIDREAITRHVTRGGQVPTASFVPDGLAGYRAVARPLFDPARAQSLLREAGYGPDRPLPPITLTYNTSEGHRQIAEAVQQMWKKHLGVDIQIANQEWRVFLKDVNAENHQIARQAWVGDYPDPFTFLELLTSTSGNNHTGWKNPEYDRLLAEGNRTADPAARLALFRQAEALLLDEAPILPIYVYARSELVKPYLRGHFPNYQDNHPFKYWWIDRRWYDGVPGTPLPDELPP